MRRLIPLLALVLACDFQAKVEFKSVPNDAALAPVASEVIVPTVTVAAPEAKRLPRRVLIVGDSEACAVGYYAKKTVAKINEENHEPADVVEIDCKGGTVVGYWGSGGNLKAALRRHQTPDDLLIFLGTNHYWNEKDTPNVQPILDEVTWSKANCVWVGNTAVHGRHWNINNLLRVAVTPECSYFDTEEANISLADGVHPTPEGAVKWLRLVWKTIPPKYEETHE